MDNFESALDKFVKSGTILLVREIDEDLYCYILGFYHLVQRGTLRKVGGTRSEGKFLVPDENFLKFLIEFERNLSKIVIPDLVKKYKDVMKRSLELKEKRYICRLRATLRCFAPCPSGHLTGGYVASLYYAQTCKAKLHISPNHYAYLEGRGKCSTWKMY